MISDFESTYNESGYYSREEPKLIKIIEIVTTLFYKWRYRIISKNFIKNKNGTILDVGCGGGRFLVEARNHGWKTFGIEPTKRSVEIAKKYSLDVIDDKLSESLFTKDMFDVISLWHVFEHIPNPDNVLSILRKWLKNDGLLVIAVPNIESLQARLGKDLWFHLDPPRHLYHFSPKTLRLILKKNGYETRSISHFSTELNHFGFIQTFLNKIGVSPNIIWNYLKNNKKGLPQRNLSLLINLLACLLALILIGLPLIVISFAESFFKRGGTILIIAQKKMRV